MTAAFATASMCYNADIEPRNRRAEPSYFGYVPDGNRARTLIFVALFMISFTKGLAVILACALFVTKFGGRAFAGLIFARISTMLCFRIVRRDFFQPALPIRALVPSILSAVFLRSCEVLFTDFSDSVDSWHPYMCGAYIYWSSVFLPWILLFTNGSSLVEHNLVTTSVALVALWMMSWLCFLGLWNKRCIGSLHLTQSAPQWIKAKWDHLPSTTEPRLRARLLIQYHASCSRLFFADAKLWVEQNWELWNATEPSWFTENRRRSLPRALRPKPAGNVRTRRATLTERFQAIDELS